MLIVRPARMADAAAIAMVYVETWRSAYPGLVPDDVLIGMSIRAQARKWADMLARRNREETVVVAELYPGGVVGFGSCGEARKATGLAPAGEIFTLYVLPEHQNRGLGEALLCGLFEMLAHRGLNSALVWVLADNPSRFFYEVMGGRRVAERVEVLWNKHLRQTCYAWDDVLLLPRQRNEAIE
ncbi:MAG: GNAT family N-acetyltransferase [Hyphomicrobiales bacterium]|nr:GNAT family N-acetyltransferase [Hyphomicrobiales bacterium]